MGPQPADHLDNPRFVEDIGLPAGASLALGPANPDFGGLEASLKLCDRVLAMRRSSITCRGSGRRPTAAGLGVSYGFRLPALSIQQAVRRVAAAERKGAYDIAVHRDTPDEISDAFAENRVLFGSDSPNSDPLGSYGQVTGTAGSTT